MSLLRTVAVMRCPVGRVYRHQLATLYLPGGQTDFTIFGSWFHIPLTNLRVHFIAYIADLRVQLPEQNALVRYLAVAFPSSYRNHRQ